MKLPICFAAFAMLLVSGATRAQNDQFYLIATLAPVASLGSEPGGQAPAVFVRWDAVESPLPAEITSLQLFRDGTKIFEGPAHPLVTAAQVQSLYAETGQARRRAEIVQWLNAEAQAPQSPPSAAVTASNFAQVIAAKLASDPFWRTFASRVDFNVARAVHRGYLDRSYPTSATQLRYELFGVTEGDVRRRLGRVDVSLAQATPIAAASNLRQLQDGGRCDAPESGLGHGSVALAWGHGGKNRVEQFAANLAVAGYDLYRSRKNAEPGSAVVPRDLAAIAKASGFDAQGRIRIADLDKVNDQPILIAADEADPDFAQFREQSGDLARANIRPGDERDYYLVARDFAGQYGGTAAIRVVVPDHLPPPAPWNVEVRQSMVSKALEFRWDEVNVPNYLHHYGTSRKICNADLARSTGRVRFVDPDEDCGTDGAREVNLRAGSYLVYRFDSYDAATQFRDSDGDGSADADERSAGDAICLTENPEIRRVCQTRPDLKVPGIGSACNARVRNGPNQVAAVVGTANVVVVNGRREVRFNDNTPGQAPGRVYWYRFRTLAGSQSGDRRNVSELSPPISAKFNDYTLPRRSRIGEVVKQQIPRSECFDYVASPEAGGNGPRVAMDLTRDARRVELACDVRGIASQNTSFVQNFAVVSAPLSGGQPGASLELSQAQCAELQKQCQLGGSPTSFDFTHLTNIETANRLKLTFRDGAGKLLDDTLITQFNTQVCAFGEQAVLRRQPNGSCPANELNAPMAQGHVGSQRPTYEVDLAQGECVSFYRDFDGQRQRVAMQCGPFQGEVPLNLPTMGLGEALCVSATLHDENNRVSSSALLSCSQPTSATNRKPTAPQPLSLEFAGTRAVVRWRRAPERNSATLVELFRGSDLSVPAQFVKVVGHPQTTPDIEGAVPPPLEIELPEPAPATGQEYCVRLRSVGVGATTDVGEILSEPSPKVCVTRMPEGVPAPQYLDWPQVPTPRHREDLTARFITGRLVPVVEVTTLRPLPTPEQSGDAECQDRYFIWSRGGNGGLGENQNNNAGVLSEVEVKETNDPHASCEDDACLINAIRFCGVSGNYRDNFCSHFDSQIQGSLHAVVYRQGRRALSETPTDWYQVSPLIDRLSCEVLTGTQNGQSVLSAGLNDPYLSPMVLGALADDGYKMVFEDRYPYQPGRQYRYQVVYFDSQGEIRETRTSNWIGIPTGATP